MGFRAQLTQQLKKYPPLYNLVAKTYYVLAPYHLLELVIGTRAQEGRWVKKSIAKEYWADRNHPAKKFLADRISVLAPFSRVLEIGCASGPNLYQLAKRFPQVEFTGIDINAAAVKYGNEHFAREGIANVTLLSGKADELEQFSDKSFDIVFTNAVLIYVGPDKIENVIKEMLRISRKSLVLMECYAFETEKDASGSGYYYGSIWIRNYAALFRRFVPEEQIRVTRLPTEVWPAEPWATFGAVVEFHSIETQSS